MSKDISKTALDKSVPVRITLIDLVRLLGTALQLTEEGEDGELGLDKSIYEISSNIQKRSELVINSDEIAGILFTVKEALLNNRADWTLLKDYDRFKRTVKTIAHLNSNVFEYNPAAQEVQLKEDEDL